MIDVTEQVWSEMEVYCMEHILSPVPAGQIDARFASCSTEVFHSHLPRSNVCTRPTTDGSYAEYLEGIIVGERTTFRWQQFNSVEHEVYHTRPWLEVRCDCSLASESDLTDRSLTAARVAASLTAKTRTTNSTLTISDEY